MDSSAPDDYAGDVTTTGTLAVGGTSHGSLESYRDTDWFRIDLTAGTFYDIEVSASRGDSTVPLWPTLFNSNGLSALALDTEDNNGTTHLLVRPETSGTYYVDLTAYVPPPPGWSDDGIAAAFTPVSYTLTASTPAVQDDHAGDTSTTATLSVGGTATGALEAPGDSDWFKITLTAGTHYAFDVLGLSKNGVLVPGQMNAALYDSRGTLLSSQSDFKLDGDAHLLFTPTTTGDYYLAAANVYPAMGQLGTYTVQAAVTTEFDQYAADPSTTGVLRLLPGSVTQVSSAIETPNDKDWFKVDLNAGTAYQFDLINATARGGTLGGTYGMTPLTLYTSDGHQLAFALSGGINGAPRLSYTPSTTGDYYLEVSSISAGTGTYTIKAGLPAADTVPGDTSTTASLAVGGQVGGYIDQPNDHDWYGTLLNAGTTYVFDLLGAHNGGTLGSYNGLPTLALHDAAGTELVEAQHNGANGEPEFGFTPSTTGKYYLDAFDTYNDTGFYTIKATVAPSHDDFGGAAATAGHLAIGGEVQGSIEVPSDIDWIQVDLKGGKTYLFDLGSARNGGGTLGAGDGTVLSLLDANGTAVERAMDTGQAGDPFGGTRIVFTPSTSGAYYLQPNDLSGQTGTYTLKATLANMPVFTQVGTDGPDVLVGTGGDDVLVGGHGDDRLDGGAGIDTAVYQGKMANYMVTKTDQGLTVEDIDAYAIGVRDGTDQLVNIERLHFIDGDLAFDTDGHAGQAYRLYQAAFNRTPDAAGLGFWIKAIDAGVSLNDVAASFVTSAEYQSIYDVSLTVTDLVTHFYQNILHRAPESGGLAFWTGVLDRHAATVPEVLAAMSESAENVAGTAAAIAHGIPYLYYG
jgi:hypothetical protein